MSKEHPPLKNKFTIKSLNGNILVRWTIQRYNNRKQLSRAFYDELMQNLIAGGRQTIKDYTKNILLTEIEDILW